MSTTSKKRGAFIVLEGVDRCGKSTQCNLLMKRIISTTLGIQQSIGSSTNTNAATPPSPAAAILQNFPDRTTPIGTIINSYLTSGNDIDDHTIHLLFSANRWEVTNTKLLSAIQDDQTTVVCDRYAYSGVCFTYAKNLLKQKNETMDTDNTLTMDWCKGPDRGLPQPDAVLYLDLLPEEAQKRGGFGNERYETKDLQIQVKKCFYDLMEHENKENNKKLWHTINAGQSIEKVHDDIWEIVSKVIKDVETKPLEKLWWKNDTQETDENDENMACTTATTTIQQQPNKNMDITSNSTKTTGSSSGILTSNN